MKTKFMNEITFETQKNIGAQLLEYLMSIRESANLMIMAVSVKEKNWQKSYNALAESFKNKIKDLSDSDQDQLSNYTSIIRYWDQSAKCMRGLSITFGRTLKAHIYDSSFKHDVDVFIHNLPESNYGLVSNITLPVIRIALTVQSMRSSLNGSEQLEQLQLDEFAMLDFNSSEWRYTLIDDSEQYEVKIESNDLSHNKLHLRISKPKKQISSKNLSAYWIFNNNSTGFSYYNIKSADLKKLKPNSNKKPAYSKTQSLKKSDAENLKELSKAISNHEVYWNGILFNLFTEAVIRFKRREFLPNEQVYIDSAFKKRSFDLAVDFFGIKSDELISEDTFTIRYFIRPELFIQDDTSDEFILIDRIDESLEELCRTQTNSTHLLGIDFQKVNFEEDADLVLGHYDKYTPWISSCSEDDIDSYGKRKLYDLKKGIINTQQFIHIDNQYSIEMLKRAVSEIFLKQWISHSQAHKKITLNVVPENNGSKHVVLFRQRNRQKSDEKPNNENMYYCCYSVESVDNQLVFSKPEVFSEIGLPQLQKESDKPDFIDFYNQRIDERLTSLSNIVEMIEKHTDCQSLIQAIGSRYLNNDVILIFEHDGQSITSIWESQHDDLWLPPDLTHKFPSDGSFSDFIRKGINAKAYTKSDSTGKIIQDKRSSSEPHYELMIEDNRLLIQRKHFNQNKNIGRQKFRQFTRIFPLETSLTFDDCSFIISGLLSSEAGAFKDSGVALTIYEKIPRLFI